MKTKIFLLAGLLIGLIAQRGSAQSTTNTNIWAAANFLGYRASNPGDLRFATAGTTLMTLQNSSGFLGIGTGSPGHLLDVSGGDINVSAGNGYMINDGYVLYSGPATNDNLFVGLISFPGAANAGTDNTFVGDNTGWTNTTGTENTYIGAWAGNYSGFATLTNDICIGYFSGTSATTVASNSIYLGNSSSTDAYAVNATWNNYSDRRIKENIQENVPGLAFITKLHPVTYNLNIHKENQLMGTPDTKDWAGKYDIEKITQSGFIAQQVDSAAQACGYDFNGVKRPKSSQGLYALAYTEFVVPLVKSVQELNTKNESLSSKIDSLTNIIQTMQTCLNQICGATGGNNGGGSATSVQSIVLTSPNAPLLYQNTPNPFNAGTKINYYLPEGTMGAMVVFYDTYGNQIKTVPISQTGSGTLNITSDNIGNGIYSYSLMVNGAVIDTKRMVLQR